MQRRAGTKKAPWPAKESDGVLSQLSGVRTPSRVFHGTRFVARGPCGRDVGRGPAAPAHSTRQLFSASRWMGFGKCRAVLGRYGNCWPDQGDAIYRQALFHRRSEQASISIQQGLCQDTLPQAPPPPPPLTPIDKHILPFSPTFNVRSTLNGTLSMVKNVYLLKVVAGWSEARR